MTTNKKRCLQAMQTLRSPIEEKMMMGGMPPAMMALMAAPRQLQMPANQVGDKNGNPQAA